MAAILMATLCSALSGAYSEQQLIEQVAMHLASSSNDDEVDSADCSGVDPTTIAENAPPQCVARSGDVPAAECAAGEPPELHDSDSESGDQPDLCFSSDSEDEDLSDDESDFGQPPDRGVDPTAGEPDIDSAPRMPCTASPDTEHRDKLPATSLYNACVARPVKPAELKVNEKARAAMQDEWDRLRRVRRPDGTFGVWDEKGV